MNDTHKNNKATSQELMIGSLIVLTLMIVITILATQMGNNLFGKKDFPIPNKVEQTEPFESTVNLKLSEVGLEGTVSSIATNLENSSIRLKTDYDYNDIASIDIFNNYVYIVSATQDNGNVSDISELLISKDNQEIDGFTQEQIREVINSDCKLETNIEEKDGTQKNQIVMSLLNEGFLYQSKSTLGTSADNTYKTEKDNANKEESSITDNASSIIKGMEISNTKDNKYGTEIHLNLEGLATDLNLSDISELGDKPGFFYGVNNQIASLFNEAEDRTKLFITHMNNTSIGNDMEKLVPLDSWNNVYIDLGWGKASDMGFGGFAVLTDVGYYYFKIGESVENYSDFLYKILNWLNIDPNAEKIEPPVPITLTMEHLDIYSDNGEASKELVRSQKQ